MIWKQVPNFSDFKIDQFGRVVRIRTLSGKIVNREIKAHRNGKGYLATRFNISSKRYSIYTHVLVCSIFIGPKPTSRHEVNHKDGNKGNNHYTNLEWVTKKENSQHRFKVLGHRNPNLGKKLSEEWKAKLRIAHSGTKNGFWGKKHTIEARRKMSASAKRRCHAQGAISRNT